MEIQATKIYSTLTRSKSIKITHNATIIVLNWSCYVTWFKIYFKQSTLDGIYPHWSSFLQWLSNGYYKYFFKHISAFMDLVSNVPNKVLLNTEGNAIQINIQFTTLIYGKFSVIWIDIRKMGCINITEKCTQSWTLENLGSWDKFSGILELCLFIYQIQ